MHCCLYGDVWSAYEARLGSYETRSLLRQQQQQHQELKGQLAPGSRGEQDPLSATTNSGRLGRSLRMSPPVATASFFLCSPSSSFYFIPFCFRFFSASASRGRREGRPSKTRPLDTKRAPKREGDSPVTRSARTRSAGKIKKASEKAKAPGARPLRGGL